MGSLALVPKGKMTRKGKATVSRNALKHGLRSGVVIRGVEDPLEWKRHLAAVVADVQPVGYLESELTRVIAELFWRRRRLPAAEAAACTAIAAEGASGRAGRIDFAQWRLSALEAELAASDERSAHAVAAKVEEARESLRWIKEAARAEVAGCLLPGETSANLLMRYEAGIDRAISRNMADLERLQRMRVGERVPAPVRVTVLSED